MERMIKLVSVYSNSSNDYKSLLIYNMEMKFKKIKKKSLDV